MENSKEKEIFPKLFELKEIINEKIKSFEDYKSSKITLLSLIEQIESILNQIFPQKEEPKENKDNNLKEKEDSIQEINNNKNNEEINKEKEENNSKLNKEENDENNNQEDEESEKQSLPKLNFDYDKNINEILSNINIEQNRPYLKTNSENDINNDLIKEDEIENKEQEIPKEENIKITNNGYSNLFSFNQDLSNMNTTEDFTSKKNKIKNSNIKEKEFINNNIIKNNNINNISIQSEENKEIENIKNTKAIRVADIIMKINSNDILYDIITQLYSKEILDQLMSPNVDINLINIIEQTIEKITILENEEIQKLRNKEIPEEKDMNIKEQQKDKYIYIDINNKKNINNYNKLNIPKRLNEYKKYKSSSSFYDKNKNNSISSISSIYNNSQKISKNKKVSSHKKNKTKVEMHLNSEILQNYPKTGKTILGYEKFKRERNKDFNFERSLRNDNYEDNYLNKRNYNLNMSKVDSIKNQSYYSINNNRSYSNKKMIFNNYTSPFGDYFDSSLQKGGESKLYYPKKNRAMLKNARSPVKDYIDGLNDAYI